MKRTFVKTWVILALAAGLFAYIFLVERKKPAPADKPKEKVFVFDKSKAKELTLATSGETIRLVREKDAWRIEAPQQVPADGSEVEAIVSSVESLELGEVVTESPADLAEFGIAKPAITISLLLEGATEPLKLLLGDKTPDGTSVYAMVPTRPRVFTLPSYLQSGFEKKPFDLRDRSVLHVKRDAVKSLEVSGPGGGYALARDDKGEWSLTRPLQTRAGRWAVDGLLGTLENLKMESVAAEDAKDLKRYGLDKPARVVTLGLADGGKATLEIGASAAASPAPTPDPAAGPHSPAASGKYYARASGSGLVAVIPQAVVDDLAKGMAEMRAKRLLDVATYEVEGLDVEADGVKKVYARSTTTDKEGVDVHKWKRTAPDQKDLDTNKVQDALFAVGGVEVQEFVDTPQAPASYGLDAPVLKVSLRHAGGKPGVWFELGVKDGAHFARRADDSAVLKLDATKAAELVKNFKEL